MIYLSNYILEKLKIGKNTKQDEPSNDPKSWGVGDILVTNAGATMILPHFWQIVSKTPKSFKVKELEQEIVDHSGFMSGTVIPKEDSFKGNETITARITKWGSINIDGHLAHIWDGKPEIYDHAD